MVIKVHLFTVFHFLFIQVLECIYQVYMLTILYYFSFQGMGNRFVRILGTNSANTSTEFTISMIESEWRLDNPQLSAVTRGQFLRTLVNVDKILVAAQMNSAAHQSR